MISRRRITATCFCLTLLAFIYLQRPSPAAAQGTAMMYCASNVGQPVVYFSPIFDTKLPLHTSVDTQPISNEFIEYLIGRFDYKGASAGCVGGYPDAETGKRKLQNQLRQANKTVVEVEWTYIPNPVEIKRHNRPSSHEAGVPPTGLPRTHTYCLSDSSDHGTFYAAGPVEGGDQTFAQWNTGFNRFLTAKYSFKGNAKCSVVTLDDAHRLIKARREGALAAGRKVVDTGWKYDPAAAPVAKQAPRDDDPEPAPKRPAPPTPTQQARDAAVKELPESKAYCQNDPMLSVVFNCEFFARSVYNYRQQNPTDTATIASLVAGGKLTLAEAVDSVQVSLWVSKTGNAQHLDNKVINCVTQNVIVTLYKQPQANELQKFYRDAVVTCSKSP